MTYNVKKKDGKVVKVICDYTYVTAHGDVMFINRNFSEYGDAGRGTVVCAFAAGMWTGYVKA